MTIKNYLKTHTRVYRDKRSFETVPTAYVVTFRIPKALFEERGMEPDKKQRVHGFGTRNEAIAHARLMQRQGGYAVRVHKVKHRKEKLQ